jgi:hypothetical protein
LSAPVLSQEPRTTELASACSSLLERMYRPDEALFPYSTCRRATGFEHDFEHPHTLRYTVNTLLGLQRAARSDGKDPFSSTAAEMVDRFLELHLEEVSSPADLGLLLLLLVEAERDDSACRELVARIESSVTTTPLAALTIQDIAWMVWGASAAARVGTAGAEDLARRLFTTMDENFVDPRSLLPRHSLSRYRRDIVSFGGIVYFLRSAYEYGVLTGESRAGRLFEHGVRAMVEIQGPQGQWPWMISSRTGIPLDFYPVFGVHQDSMAMLFLLPALGDGLVDVEVAITRSLDWSLGDNELGVPMYGEGSFFAYRSIHRAQRLVRPRRYARSLARSFAQRPGAPAKPEQLTVNRECRSYHLGWILFAWAGRTHHPRLEPS